MPGILTFGETMGLVRASDLGGWETVSNAQVSIGGADSNVAIGLRRLGVDAAWVGRVGDDALGRRVEREIRAEGVRTRAVVDPDRPTGLMLKERRTPTHSRVSFYRSDSAGSRLRADDIRDEDIATADVVLVNGVTASLSESAQNATLSVLERARRLGTTIAFDVNHRASLWVDRDPHPLYHRIASHADLVFAGDDEARLVTGAILQTPEAVATAVADLGPSEVVLKNGAAGARSLVDGRLFRREAIPITPVDTVGAGDAFVAGYLAARLDGASVDDRLRMGVRCGAFACLSPGDWEGLPRRSDLRLLEAADPVER